MVANLTHKKTRTVMLALSTCVVMSCGLLGPPYMPRFEMTLQPTSAHLGDSVRLRLAVHNYGSKSIMISWPGCPSITVTDLSGRTVGPSIGCLGIPLYDTQALPPGDSSIRIDFWGANELADGETGSFWVVSSIGTAAGPSSDSALVEIVR